MTQGVRDWLPNGSLTDDRVRRALAGTVEGWAKRYVQGAIVGIALRTERRLASDTPGLVVERPGFRIMLPESGRRVLLAGAIGADCSGLASTDADDRLLSGFADRLVDALAEELVSALPPGSADPAEMRVDLLLGEAVFATLVLSRRIMLALVKVQFVAKSGKRPPRPRSEALVAVDVPLSATIGSAALTVEDIAHLALGDVLILDRTVAAGASLRLDAGAAAIARGELSAGHGHNILILASS